MEGLFADFDADGGLGEWDDVVVRAILPADAPACAALLAERHGLSTQAALDAVSRWTVGDRLALVAVRSGVVLGFGRAEWLDPSSAGGDAPSGWYLSGVQVAPEARRRGVGAGLTAERIRVLRPIAEDVRFCVNLRNRASIALHERFGFHLETRDFDIPGVTFEGGAGGLFRLVLREA